VKVSHRRRESCVTRTRTRAVAKVAVAKRRPIETISRWSRESRFIFEVAVAVALVVIADGPIVMHRVPKSSSASTPGPLPEFRLPSSPPSSSPESTAATPGCTSSHAATTSRRTSSPSASWKLVAKGRTLVEWRRTEVRFVRRGRAPSSPPSLSARNPGHISKRRRSMALRRRKVGTKFLVMVTPMIGHARRLRRWRLRVVVHARWYLVHAQWFGTSGARFIFWVLLPLFVVVVVAVRRTGKAWIRTAGMLRLTDVHFNELRSRLNMNLLRRLQLIHLVAKLPAATAAASIVWRGRRRAPGRRDVCQGRVPSSFLVDHSGIDVGSKALHVGIMMGDRAVTSGHSPLGPVR
jgi:hypothetical protein